MKRLPLLFTAPALVGALLFLAGCSSDNPTGSNTGGASSGGSASGGKSGAGGSPSGGGAGAAGSSAAGTGGTAGSGTAGSGTAGSSTAGSGTGGEPAIEATFATVKSIIGLKCFGSGCHSEEGNPFQMKADDTLYASLMGHTTKTCGKLVNVASPATSALVKLLQADCNGTPRMPLQGSCPEDETDPDSPCVQPARIAAIQAWIAKGAPQQ